MLTGERGALVSVGFVCGVSAGRGLELIVGEWFGFGGGGEGAGVVMKD